MDFDAIIVFTYLIGTLVYGLYVGKGVKDINDYAVGDRNFSTPILAATIFATYASSSGFYINLTKSYEDGLYKFFATFGQTISLLLAAFLFAPRMKEFFGKLSVPEMIGHVYGKRVRVLSSVSMFMKSAGYVAIQIKVLSSTLEYFTNIDTFTSTILTSCVIILYSAFGGVRAVTFTDFIQFATFGIAIPMIFVNVLYTSDIAVNVSKQHLFIDHVATFNPDKLNYYFVLFLYYLTLPIDGPMTQRMLMGNTTYQIKEAVVIALVLLVIIVGIATIMGVVIKVENPNLESTQILPYLIDNYTNTGTKGLLIIGILAMAMSTADTNLNIAAVTLSHDFCAPLNLVSEKNELYVSKIFSMVCGIIAIIIALNFKDLLDIILFIGAFYLPVVALPLLLAIFGFRSSERAVIIGIIFGVFIVIFWDKIAKNYLGYAKPISSFIPGMIAHMIGLFGTHYLLGEKGGWGQGPGKGRFNSPTN